ncbi:MAG: hypothetical protein GXP62_03440 [Oligoflexia bacterium]|nr:hypothetical protein [Oligoflexia bacterium]
MVLRANREALDALALPDSIRAAIQQRIDILGVSEGLTLRVASVLGSPFWFREICAIHPRSERHEDLAQQLGTLANEELLTAPVADAGQRFSFQSLLVRDVAYDSLLPSQRQRLHRRTAEWREREEATRKTSAWGRLAFHWLGADEAPRAIPYLARAGEDAARSFAHQETIDALQHALDLQERLHLPHEQAQTARWHRLVGEALVGLGSLDRGRAHLETAAALLGYPVATSRLGRLIRLAWVGGRQVWKAFGVRAVNTAADDRRLEAARAHGRLALLGIHANDRLTSLSSALESLDIAQRTVASGELVRGYAAAGGAAALLGLGRLRDRWFSRAEEAVSAARDPSAESFLRLVIGTLQLSRGRWTQAKQQLERGASLSREFGDLRRVGECLTVLMFVHHSVGALEETRAVSQALEEVARQRGDTHHTVAALVGEAAVGVTRGDVSTVGRVCATADEVLARAAASSSTELTIHAFAAWAAQRRGDALETETRWAQSADALLDSSLVNPTLIWALSTLCDVFLTAHSQASTPVWASRARGIALERAVRRFARSFPFAHPLRSWFLGSLDHLHGRERRSVRRLRQARAAAARMGMTEWVRKRSTWE